MKPRLLDPTCVQENLRLPRDRTLNPGEVIRARFAVGLDGQPTDFSMITSPGDSRIDQAIWAAIQRCRFAPGTDSKGTPTVGWVVMPFRFDQR